MAVQLEQSPFLRLISDERVEKTLGLMGLAADARLTPAVGREICERTGSAAVLDGSIASLGSEYVLGLRAVRCGTGEVLDAEQAQAARKEDVLKALGEMATRFRGRVGESLETVKEHNMPLEEATTGSLEALKAYSAGRRLMASSGDLEALPMFKRAVEMDPKFAMAYSWLGRIYGDIEEPGLSAGNTTKAYELRGRTSDAEKFFIESSYELQVTGNLEKALEVCRAWEEAYPREAMPHTYAAGIPYTVAGQYEKANEEMRRANELDPDFAFPYFGLASSFQRMGRLDESDAALDRAAKRGVTMPEFLGIRYNNAFLRGDRAGMERQVAAAQGKPDESARMAEKEAMALAYSGRAREAGKMLRSSVEQIRQAGQPEVAALYEVPEALWEGFYGEGAAAKESARVLLEHSKELYVEYGAAFALGLAGDSARSAALAEDIERRFGEDTAVRLSYLPALRGQGAVENGDSAKALEVLEVARPTEFGSPRSAIHGNFGALYPVYVRVRLTWRWVEGRRLRWSLRRSWTTGACCCSIQWGRWRDCSWGGRMRWLGIGRRPARRTRIF
jgi:eukaryotic-like serine/threonine-protein kinase